MINDELRQEVVEILGLSLATEDEKAATLEHLDMIVRLRMARVMAGFLSAEQLQYIEVMSLRGMQADVIKDWVSAQVPHYDQLVTAVVLDSAEEAAA